MLVFSSEICYYERYMQYCSIFDGKDCCTVHSTPPPYTPSPVYQELRAILETFDHPPKALVKSFGCQLNFCDGEKYKGVLSDLGYVLTDSPEDADVILFNTCAVREHAQSRVTGQIGSLKSLYERNPSLIIGLCGCMAEEEEVRALIRKSYPFVKMILGAGAMEKLAESLLNVYRADGKRYETTGLDGLPDESLPTVREHHFLASVPVMYGCNNFCTYCIVPYVRGRERSRSPKAIEAEVRSLVEKGYKEILLLGQNVNSYGKDLEEPMNFPELLRRLDAIKGEYWIRFMSSHPKDATPELIEVMLHSEHIEHHLHLPVQSGSNRVLEEMNRRYTIEKYLSLIQDTREKNPDFSFSSDLIVGFPTETAADFEQTLSLIETVRYDNLYTFIYSPRPGTKAAAMPQVSSPEEISQRMQTLLSRQREISEAHNARFIGKSCMVLVEKYDGASGKLNGKTREAMNVEITGADASSEALVGTMVSVRITAAKNWALVGTLE